jgi:hypothetical protein
MSHGASACFMDKIETAQVSEKFPKLKPLFDAVLKHEVYGLLESVLSCCFASLADVQNELTEVVAQEEDEIDEAFEKRVERMAKSFHKAYTALLKAFKACTGCELSTEYIDGDSIDGYSDVEGGRHWYVYDYQVPKPKAAKAIRKGLKIERCFYAVYG